MPSTGENQPSGSLGSSLEGGLTPPPLVCWGSLLGALLNVTKHYIPSRAWVFFVWMPPSLAFLLAREGVPRLFLRGGLRVVRALHVSPLLAVFYGVYHGLHHTPLTDFECSVTPHRGWFRCQTTRVRTFEFSSRRDAPFTTPLL